MSASSALGRFFLSLGVEARDPWIGVMSLMDEPLFVRGVMKGYAASPARGVVVLKGGGGRVAVGHRGPGHDDGTPLRPRAGGLANPPLKHVVWTI